MKYPMWLANIVLGRKAVNKWRMCVDFSDQIPPALMDPYPLPDIDYLIDGFSGYHTLGFMDAYSGYNQIYMDPLDAPKTSLISNHENYHYYNVMSFSLKNVGATYQLLMNVVFSHQIWHNIEVYVDDMMVKTTEGHNHAMDLKDVQLSIKKYNMHLNLAKCSFGGSSLEVPWVYDEEERALKPIRTNFRYSLI